MPKRKKHSASYQLDNHEESTFMEDLETSLLTSNEQHYGIDAFQAVFDQKKIINALLDQQKKMKEEAKDSCIKAKQRIVQIGQLNNKVQRQTSLLKSQIEKITDAHNISKLLMMEKIVKLQRQTDELQKKKNKCFQARVQKQKLSILSSQIISQRRMHSRLGSLSETLQMRNQLESQKNQALTERRTKVQSVRAEEERRRTRSQRIEEFKINRAKKNYHKKLQSMKNTIENAQDTLNNLYNMQMDEQKVYRATREVTTKYLRSFFPTQTI